MKHERRLTGHVYAIALWERTDPAKYGPGYLAIEDGHILTFTYRDDADRVMHERFSSVPASQKRVVRLVPH